MSGRIQECDLSSACGHHIGADVLGNSACLPVCHIGMADGIQKRGLSMINMAHNTDNRRSPDQSILRILLIFQHLPDDVFLHLRFRIKIVLHGNLTGRVEIQL